MEIGTVMGKSSTAHLKRPGPRVANEVASKGKDPLVVCAPGKRDLLSAGGWE
jgi:hypothetical protein